MKRGFGAVAELSLPAGKFVEDGDGPLIWLSDGEPEADLVAGLRARHAETGLWPVVVGDQPRYDFGPRVLPGYPGHHFASSRYTGLSSARARLRARPVLHDPDSWLAEQWADAIADNEANGHWKPEEKVSAQVPRGKEWPGLAPAAEPLADPSAIADWHTTQILDENWLDDPRLALMPGETSSEALAASWWAPPNTGNIAFAVNILRSWEERFGTRVVALRPDTLFLSVGAPPITREHTVHLACEHLAFSRDTIWQCSESFAEHVEICQRAPSWCFWWD